MEAALALLVRHGGGHVSAVDLRYLLRMGHSSLLLRTTGGGKGRPYQAREHPLELLRQPTNNRRN